MRHFATTRRTPRGFSLLLGITLSSVIILLLFAIAGLSTQNLTTARHRINDQEAIRLAEAGIEKAVWCLNNPSNTTDCPGNPNYVGENNTALGNGTFTIAVSGTGNARSIDATGSIGSKSSKTIRVELNTSSAEISFIYGVQVGAGGLTLDNNAAILGNVYSNGSIVGAPNVQIDGSVFVAGGTSLTPDQEQTNQSSDFDAGRTAPCDPTVCTDAAQSFKANVTDVLNKVTLLVRRVGSPSNATVRIVNDNGGVPGTTELANGTLVSSAAALAPAAYDWVEIGLNTTPALTAGTTYWIVLDVNTNNNSKYLQWAKHFNSGYGNGIGLYNQDWDDDPWFDANGDFGFQTWMGGVVTRLEDVIIPSTPGGIVHADTIEGSNIIAELYCMTLINVILTGDVGCGSISSSIVNGDVTTETLTGSTVNGDVTCESESGNTISGTVNCPTPVTPPANPPPAPLPVSDAQITQWENDALLGGTITPPGGPGMTYQPTDGEQLGPVMIDGDLHLNNGVTVTLTGTVWVKGNLTTGTGAVIQLSPSYGVNSGLMVFDDPADQATAGKIEVNNGTNVLGSGTSGSYIMMLSTNTGVLKGVDTAIAISNNVDGAIFYASQGMVEIFNNAQLKEVTGFALHLHNNSTVQYESGLANANFTNGPGGGWTYQRGTYQILN